MPDLLTEDRRLPAAAVLPPAADAALAEGDCAAGAASCGRRAAGGGWCRTHLALREGGDPRPAGPEVSVPCRIVDEDGTDVLVAVGRGLAYRLVPVHEIEGRRGPAGRLRARVAEPLRWPLVVTDLPGMAVTGGEEVATTVVPGFTSAVALGAARSRPPAALPAAPPLTVAFLVASKNGRGTIGDTIRSAAVQGPVFAVSDGSDDDTVAVAEAAGAVVLDLETNVGKPTALRRAIERFGLTRRYDAIAILDDDTIVDPDFLEHCRARLAEPGVVIAVGRTVTRWGDDFRWNLWLASRAYAYWRYQVTLRRGQSALNVMTCISGSNSVYRSSLLDQVLVEHTPYIVDDTFWTLETHRRKLGRIVYVPEARAHICDPTNLRDWYRQNVRWMWGTFQGINGHRIGRERSLLDATYVLQILDWVVYVLLAPLLAFFAMWRGWIGPEAVAVLTLLGYTAGAAVAAVALRKWRLAVMGPALIVVDWLYRAVFVHAFYKTLRQPRVESCRWESPTRYT